MKTSVEARARAVFLGVLVLGAAAALAWYLFRSNEYATYQIRTRDAVSGLIADAPVEFHGVEVGKVKRVELTDPHSVRILLSVKKDAPITTATVATITGRGLATRGFTGYVYVSLEDLGSDARPLIAAAASSFPAIPTAPSRSATLDTAISQLNQNVQSMTDLLESALDRKTIASLKQSAESLERVTRTLAENNEKLASIIGNTQRASARLEPLLRSADDTIGALRVDVIPQALRTFAGLDRTSAQLEPLLRSSNESARALQMQILPEAYRTLGKLDNLSTSLSNVTTEIQRDPSIFIRGSSPPPGPGESK